MNARTTLFASVGVVALTSIATHAFAIDLAARAGGVQALLSPGTHSPIVGLLVAAVLLSSRVITLVALPAVILGFTGFFVACALIGRGAERTSSPGA